MMNNEAIPVNIKPLKANNVGLLLSLNRTANGLLSKLINILIRQAIPTAPIKVVTG